MTEAQACENADVYIVGGGNSAGQAAMYLSRFAQQVCILIRRDSLNATMSQYLIDQIRNTPNISILPKTVVVKACGNGRLDELVLQHVLSKKRQNECKGEQIEKDTFYNQHKRAKSKGLACHARSGKL